MNRRHLLLAGASAWLLAPSAVSAQAEADPLATLDSAQRRAVKAFLARHSTPREGGAQPTQVLLADMDGDGHAELVLLWIFLGPTFAHSHVAVFTSSAAGWRDRAHADVLGQAQGMSIKGNEIRIASLTLGPNDGRCCPSVKAIQRLRWSAGKITSQRR